MHKLLNCIMVLISADLLGQTSDTISISHKEEKYYLTKTCYDFLKWDEVVLKNKTIEAKINSVIQKAAQSYKLSKDDAEERCHRRMEYEYSCNISFAKFNLISCYFTSYTYFTGAAHGGRVFNTLNFNAQTGEKINFHDFFDKKTLQEVDTLIMRKLKKRTEGFDFDLSEQLADLEFRITGKGIEILFRGPNYVSSILDLTLTFKELKTFINNEGPLKDFY